jgi:AcrR family transcriptional regulator
MKARAIQPVRKRRNLPYDMRAREILDAALQLFAERGFDFTLQELADRIGVTQPLLHRYFATKADLFAACREALMRGHWKPEWRDIIADRRRPLHLRLGTYYRDYWPRIYRRFWYRGFIFFALSDPTFAQDYLQQVNREILELVIAEVRRDFGFPSPAETPIHEREFELIWGMHSTFAFLGQRHFIYEMPMPADLSAMIDDQVDSYLAAAPKLMADLMPRRRPLARSASRARYIRTRAKGKARR